MGKIRAIKTINPIKAINRIFNKREINVYFISGMCYNCSVFDKLTLPKGFKRNYIEWIIPRENESLSHYAYEMARPIDTSRPFILIGYSFGAVIMQEMNKFLTPQKSIIISSFKSKDEIPSLFSAVKFTKIAEHISKRMYEHTEFISDAFNKLVYKSSSNDVAGYMTITNPAYIQWAIEQITNWVPAAYIPNLYHIHGTEDQIFPYKHIKNAMLVEGGDHLMLVKKADTVSALLGSILLSK